MSEQTPEQAMSAALEHIDKINSVIATARRLLAEGKMVDLSALEGKVQELVEKIDALQSGDAATIDSAVEMTRRNLDRLEEELTAQYQSVAGENGDGGPDS